MCKHYFKDKVVWITGASSGIGYALALELDKRGASMVISGRNEKALAKLAKQLSNPHLVLPFDVSDCAANQDAAKKIIQQFKRLDVSVVNAGISSQVSLKHYAKGFDDIIKTNILGAAYTIDASLKSMLKQNAGHIVAMCSLAGLSGMPKADAYCASKAAIKSMMQSLAANLGKTSIKTSCIYPGFIKTPLLDGSKHPTPFLMQVDKAVKVMANGIARRQLDIYLPWRFAIMVRMMTWLLPNRVYIGLLKRLG